MAVGSGPDTIPFLFIGTFVTMLVAIPIFGWIASRYPRRVFLPWIYLFFASNVLIFWGVFSLTVNQGKDYVWLGRIFFVWISIFNLFVVSVFWSFMADIFTREQGRVPDALTDDDHRRHGHRQLHQVGGAEQSLVQDRSRVGRGHDRGARGGLELGRRGHESQPGRGAGPPGAPAVPGARRSTGGVQGGRAAAPDSTLGRSIQ